MFSKGKAVKNGTFVPEYNQDLTFHEIFITSF